MPRRLLAALATAFVALALALPAGAARTPGALVGPVRLVPRGGPIQVAGLHGYFGQVVISPATDGLLVTNRLPLERYLLGLQEVPPSWPEEALRAQAVAARTYALWTLSRPRAGAAATYGFDICATVECQVFSGSDVVEIPDGQRWAKAVRDTAGEAVLYDGRPILARYHSTSGGVTLDNPQAFPGEPDYPYLQGVPSRTEQGSPLYRWEVRFPLDHLQAMLSNGGLWTRAHGMLRRAVSVRSSSGFHYPDIVLTGTRKNLRVDAESLRDVVRTQGPALYPGVYPSRWFTTSGRLPETLPANRIDVVTRKGVAVVTGRGWGHGTGMSQWGAHGLAEAGASYRDILAHYYTGTAVGEVDAPPTISVGVAWGESSVTATGAFDVVDGRGDVAVSDALGSWTFTPGGGGVVRVDPPEGHSLPLRVGIVAAPKRAEPGERVPITFALSKPARLRVGSGEAAVHRAGRGRVFWTAPRDPGSYDVTLVASSGQGESEERRVEIRVVAQDEATPSSVPAEERDGVAAGLIRLLIGAVLIGLLITGLGSRIK
ncbi:MAG: SpoIID/LytB domain-containing protein [Actinomycetota bacterium]|nr:SpoIID/LytB domain-containing protein [Actinomycetota bacterium]